DVVRHIRLLLLHSYILSLTFVVLVLFFPFFFFNDPAPTEIYTLSLHDALPIFPAGRGVRAGRRGRAGRPADGRRAPHAGAVRQADRKSTRLNSSHVKISYAVFCLKKKKKK